MLRVLFSLVLTGFLCLQAPAFAHAKREALISVVENDRTQKIEVVHRFSLHDAEHAAQLQTGKQQSLLASKELLEAFAEYVVSQFVLEEADKVIELDFVGVEVERGYVWIYQEFQPEDKIESLSVYYAALSDIWSDQINTMNVDAFGEFHTLVLSERAPKQTIKFGQDTN